MLGKKVDHLSTTNFVASIYWWSMFCPFVCLVPISMSAYHGNKVGEINQLCPSLYHTKSTVFPSTFSSAVLNHLCFSLKEIKLFFYFLNLLCGSQTTKAWEPMVNNKWHFEAQNKHFNSHLQFSAVEKHCSTSKQVSIYIKFNYMKAIFFCTKDVFARSHFPISVKVSWSIGFFFLISIKIFSFSIKMTWYSLKDNFEL